MGNFVTDSLKIPILIVAAPPEYCHQNTSDPERYFLCCLMFETDNTDDNSTNTDASSDHQYL